MPHQIVQQTSRHFSPWRRLPRSWRLLVYCCDCGMCHEWEFALRVLKASGRIEIVKRLRVHKAESRIERKRKRKPYVKR